MSRDTVLLRVFIGEEDRHRGRPLFKAIVAKALENKMAGATVLPGPEGFGGSRHVRSEVDVEAERVPLVVEIIDQEEQINRFLPVLDEMIESGLVTLENVRAIHYRRDRVRSSVPERLPAVD